MEELDKGVRLFLEDVSVLPKHRFVLNFHPEEVWLLQDLVDNTLLLLAWPKLSSYALVCISCEEVIFLLLRIFSL